MRFFDHLIVYIQGGPKKYATRLPNDQKIVLNRIKVCKLD